LYKLSLPIFPIALSSPLKPSQALLNKKMKIKNKILITALLILVCLPFIIYAFSEKDMANANVYLRIKQLDWNTFYFEPTLNFLNSEDISFVWEFSDGYVHQGKELLRQFESGDYQVKLIAVDYYGRHYTRTADIKVDYWTLQNKWFWGFFYLFILVLIVYYWFVKLIYIANEKMFNEHAEAFIEALDEVDFWKNLVKAMKSKR